MDNSTDRFVFSAYDNVGNSGFGQAHGPHVDLRPELPSNTSQVFGVDLSSTIYASDVAITSGPKVNGPGGGNGGGGGGGAGGGSYPDYTSAIPGSTYNITIHFNGSNWTAAEHLAFVDAANRISSLITGDVPDVTVLGMKGGPQVIDDIKFTAELKTIDGVGGILGQTGPTSIRTVGSLPATATMQFDSADAQHYVDSGQFSVIVLHEMLHGVGFGSVWSYLGLTSGSTFIGAHAEAEYATLISAANPTPVPLETGGGSGTAGSHWSEPLFNSELMTGYIDTLPDPLSRLTVASLQDLGYTVNYAGPIDGYILGA